MLGGAVQAADTLNHATCLCPVPLTGGQELRPMQALGLAKPGR